jgi:hypothetical protein
MANIDTAMHEKHGPTFIQSHAPLIEATDQKHPRTSHYKRGASQKDEDLLPTNIYWFSMIQPRVLH